MNMIMNKKERSRPKPASSFADVLSACTNARKNSVPEEPVVKVDENVSEENEHIVILGSQVVEGAPNPDVQNPHQEDKYRVDGVLLLFLVQLLANHTITPFRVVDGHYLKGS